MSITRGGRTMPKGLQEPPGERESEGAQGSADLQEGIVDYVDVPHPSDTPADLRFPVAVLGDAQGAQRPTAEGYVEGTFGVHRSRIESRTAP